jgi:CheY-like chemotaxis protein
MRRNHVLLVDDDDDMRTLYGFILACAGFKVKAVKNGLEALAELQEHRPDVIVTDLAMPIVDGLQLIRIVKNRPELADIPVIAITAYGKNMQDRARLAEADKVIDKPTEYRSVCDIIASVLPQQ